MGAVGSHCTSHHAVEIKDTSVPITRTGDLESDINERTEKVRHIFNRFINVSLL